MGTEWVTEAVLGEPAIVLERRDGWALVALPVQPSRLDPRGYPGWVPARALVERSDEPAWQTVARATVVTDDLGLAVLALPQGSLLPGEDGPEGDRVRVRLPDGRRGWARRVDLRPYPPAVGGRGELLEALKVWTDQPYVWGGTSSIAGADCSGLVLRLHQRIGIVVPRDADEQYDAAVVKHPGTLEGARKGDLVFFSRPDGEGIDHVGVYLGDGKYLSEKGRARGVAVRDVGEDGLVAWGSYLPEESERQRLIG